MTPLNLLDIHSYIGADGQLYKVTYQADHRGFRAQGAHLPWSLPVYNTIVDSSQSLNVMKEEVAQVVQVVSEEEKKEENISVVEAAEQEVAPEITINEGQGIPDEGLNALEIELAKNQATLDTIQSEGVNRDENLTVNKVVKEEILPEITPETTQMEVKNDNTAVQGVEDQISILPELIETEEELIKDEDFVLMEDELPAAAEPTEQLTIHVPLIAKVYSLQKATKPGGKPRKTNGKTSRIIRYKLAYQPSWRNGESALIPISE